MRSKYLQLLLPAMLGAAGCATNPAVSLLNQVGPSPGTTAKGSGTGFLQVYSALDPLPGNKAAEDMLWNSEFGPRVTFRDPVRTSYYLYDSDGKLLRFVANQAGLHDDVPSLVSLPAGNYKVRAEAEDGNDATMTVLLPVQIEPGQTTAVHLEPNWTPSADMKQSVAVVRLPNGNIVGWQASDIAYATTPANPQPDVVVGTSGR